MKKRKGESVREELREIEQTEKRIEHLEEKILHKLEEKGLAKTIILKDLKTTITMTDLAITLTIGGAARPTGAVGVDASGNQGAKLLNIVWTSDDSGAIVSITPNADGSNAAIAGVSVGVAHVTVNGTDENGVAVKPGTGTATVTQTAAGLAVEIQLT